MRAVYDISLVTAISFISLDYVEGVLMVKS